MRHLNHGSINNPYEYVATVRVESPDSASTVVSFAIIPTESKLIGPSQPIRYHEG